MATMGLGGIMPTKLIKDTHKEFADEEETKTEDKVTLVGHVSMQEEAEYDKSLLEAQNISVGSDEDEELIQAGPDLSCTEPTLGDKEDIMS